MVVVDLVTAASPFAFRHIGALGMVDVYGCAQLSSTLSALDSTSLDRTYEMRGCIVVCLLPPKPIRHFSILLCSVWPRQQSISIRSVKGPVPTTGSAPNQEAAEKSYNAGLVVVHGTHGALWNQVLIHALSESRPSPVIPQGSPVTFCTVIAS